MADFAVSTLFDGKNNISKMFDAMYKSAYKFGDGADKSFKKATKSASTFSTVTKSILAAGAVQKGLSLLQTGVMSVTSEFIQFDDAIVGAGARFSDIDNNAKDFESQLKDIRKAAREAGATTEFTAAQSAKALDFLARAGFTSVEAIGSLNSMINLATATGEDFASVADWSSDLLGAFGLNANDAATKIKNLNRLNDVLVKTANSANVTVENMFETMKAVGPVSGILGASLEEVAALTAVLGNAGIKGSDAMTALKNAYLRLAAPAGAGADILKELNITLDNGKGGAKKMTTIMSELAKKMQGLGKVKQAEILDAVFGKRAIAGSKNILDNIKNIDKFEQTLLKAGGTSQQTAELMRNSLGNRLKSLQSAAIETGFKILDAFKTDGVDAITSLTNAFRDFDVKPVVEGLKTAANFAKLLYAVVSPFVPLMPYIITYFLAFAAAQKVIMWSLAIKHFFVLAKAIQAASAAQGILNVVMTANPIGLIAAAIAGLITLVVALWMNFDKVKASFVAMKDWIIGGLKTMWDWFSKMLDNPFFAGIAALLMPFITIPSMIVKYWQPISDFFEGLFSKIFGIFGTIGKFLGITGGNKGAPTKPVTGPENIVSPNQQDVRYSSGRFDGRLEIANAPEGSRLQSAYKGPGQFDAEMLGANL